MFENIVMVVMVLMIKYNIPIIVRLTRMFTVSGYKTYKSVFTFNYSHYVYSINAVFTPKFLPSIN